MKKFAVTMLVALAAPALVAPAWAAVPVCLRLQDITSTHSPDGKVLMVTMRDGKVWRNDLQGGCPGLVFDGFKWVIHGPAEICEYTQSLQVLRSGEVCTLGKFTEQPKAHK